MEVYKRQTLDLHHLLMKSSFWKIMTIAEEALKHQMIIKISMNLNVLFHL